ncbi:hypothetical protein OSTOST_07369, partial [Ostertagia ostertagi]
AQNPSEVLTPCSAEEEEEDPGSNRDVISFECEEPTEEQVANAMRHSSTSCSEASPMEENGAGVSEEHNEERNTGECTKDAELDDTGLCPKCGSSEDPQFIHYKKIVKPIDSNYGAFIWRYCCARKECAEFFGDYYAYDKVTNSFVTVPEESAVPEETEIKSEPKPSELQPNESQSVSIAEEITEQTPSVPPCEGKCADEHSVADVKETPSTPVVHRSSRRQKQTSRKRTATLK